jgi:hypothetical protein
VLWSKSGYDPAYCGPFRNFVEDSIEREIVPPKSRSFPEYHCHPIEATTKLCQQDPGLFALLSEKLFSAPLRLFFFFTWPQREILEACFKCDPARAATLWTRARSSAKGSLVNSSDFNLLPFAAAPDCVRRLCCDLIEAVSDDWQLAELASRVVEHDHVSEIVEWIRQTLSCASSAGDIARAVTLAGFLDNSDCVRTLWETELKEPLLDGWIGTVHARAKDQIQRNWNALYWLNQMLEAKSDEDFFGRWRLFAKAVDYSILPRAGGIIRNRLDLLPARQRSFIQYNWKTLNETTEKVTKQELERSLFFTSKGPSYAMPWAA